MPGIAKKLRYLIGDQSVNSWAKDHDFTPQTVHDWIKFDRRPTGASMKSLVAATRRSKGWWLDGKDPRQEEDVSSVPYTSTVVKPALVCLEPKPEERQHATYQINVDAMVQAICVMFQTATKGESLQQTARKAVAFYQYCVDIERITPTGEGKGNDDLVV